MLTIKTTVRDMADLKLGQSIVIECEHGISVDGQIDKVGSDGVFHFTTNPPFLEACTQCAADGNNFIQKGLLPI